MSWPLSFLNASNRELREQLERATARLDTRQQECAEHREVLALIRESLTQTKAQAQSTNAAVVAKANALDAEKSAALQLQHETDGAAKLTAKYQEEYTRISTLVRQTSAAIESKRDALRAEAQLSVELEVRAKQAVLEGLEKRKFGEELEAEQRALTTSVWARLESMHAEVTAKEQELAAVTAEHRHLLSELDAMRVSLQEGLKDQRESVAALDAVHKQTTSVDAEVALNGESMQTLLEASTRATSTREELQRKLASLQAEAAARREKRESSRAQYDALLSRLRATAGDLKTQGGEMTSSERHVRAEREHKAHLAAQLAHCRVLCEEKATVLAQMREQFQLLTQTQESLKQQQKLSSRDPSSSVASLYLVQVALQRQLAQLEDRLERTEAKVGVAIQDFMNVGTTGESIGDEIVNMQVRVHAVATTQEQVRATAQQATRAAQALDAHLAQVRAALPDLMATAQQQRLQRQKQFESTVQNLRDELQRATRRYRELLESTGTFKAVLRRAKEAQVTGVEKQSQLIAERQLMERETATLESEAVALQDARRAVEVRASAAHVTLAAMMRAADAHVEFRADAAGAGEYLRAQAVMEEEKLQAEMQAMLLELHLEQNARREHAEELRRHMKQRELLRGRYEEIMTTLARSMEQAQGESSNPATFADCGLLSLHACGGAVDGASKNPEMLHARVLLQRSCEREQLMERGNYLDLRLLSLERETQSLHRTLEMLRAECRSGRGASSSSVAMTVLGKDAPHGSSSSSSPPPPSSQRLQHKKNTEAVEFLQESLAERAQAFQAEVQLQELALEAMRGHREGARARLAGLKKELARLQCVEKQKRTQMQRLRDELQRERQRTIKTATAGSGALLSCRTR